MRFYVGVMDHEQYEYLFTLKPYEINFWQPCGDRAFRALQPGELFLFKLHSPYNAIAGGGFFVKHAFLPVSYAWRAFEQNNGVPKYETLRSKINQYRHGSRKEHDPIIGCIILADPFFLSKERWINSPSDWKPNIVQGKRYNTESVAGAAVWNQVKERLQIHTQSLFSPWQDLVTSKKGAHFDLEYLTRARLGLGGFRVLVTDAYKRRCCFTGECTLPVLDAVHIKPFSQSGPHQVNNGILLRTDLHRLFDNGYLTITKDYFIEVSPRIREDYKNGKHYYALHGNQLSVLPADRNEWPSLEFIEWHNQHLFAK